MHPVQPYNENTHVGHDGQLGPQQRSNEAVYSSIQDFSNKWQEILVNLSRDDVATNAIVQLAQKIMERTGDWIHRDLKDVTLGKAEAECGDSHFWYVRCGSSSPRPNTHPQL
ncbi:hypothetical protein HBI47_058660 [Parastagonospora nodorum]|nr:hypothetical protein HBI47_058660 [Parastagonospora nodorum]